MRDLVMLPLQAQLQAAKVIAREEVSVSGLQGKSCEDYICFLEAVAADVTRLFAAKENGQDGEDTGHASFPLDVSGIVDAMYMYCDLRSKWDNGDIQWVVEVLNSLVGVEWPERCEQGSNKPEVYRAYCSAHQGWSQRFRCQFFTYSPKLREILNAQLAVLRET